MTQQTNPCGCGSLPRTLITGRYAERPSPESSPLVAVSGGRAEAQRSRPERPALSKSAGGAARCCGPPGSGAPLEPHSLGVVLEYALPLAWARGPVQVPSPQDRHPVRPFVRQHGPAPAKASAPSPPTCSKSCCTAASWSASSTCAIMPCSCCLLPAGGATPSECGQEGAMVLVGSP